MKRSRARRSAQGVGFRAVLNRAEVPLFSALVALPAVCLGAVHTGVLLATAGLNLVALAVVFSLRDWRATAPSWFALGAAILCLVQAVPLPLSWVETLAPASAKLWSEARAAMSPLQQYKTAHLSIDPSASLIEATRWFCYAVAFLLGDQIARTRGLRVVLAVIVGSCSLIAATTMAHGLVQAEGVYGFYEPSVFRGRWTTSPLINPNNLAGYLNLGVFSALALGFSRRGGLSRWLCVISLPLLVSQVVLSGSRGGVGCLVLGLAGVFLVLLANPKSRRSHRSQGGLVFGAVVLGAGLAALGADHEVLSELSSGNAEKLKYPPWVSPLFKEYWLIGCGAGAFEAAVSPFQPAWQQSFMTHPENFVIAWMVEWGVVFGAVALSICVWLFRPGAVAVKGRLKTSVAYVGVLMFIVQNLADVAFSVPACLIALAAVLGGLRGARGASKEEAGSRADLPTAQRSQLPLLAVTGAGLLLGGMISRPALAWEDRKEAHRLMLSSDFSDPAETRTFDKSLKRKVLAHPGDPYLPAIIALSHIDRPGGTPFYWFGRSLARAPRRGQTHLLLAEALARRGAVGQAMMEMRLAASFDEVLAQRVAQRALLWTKDVEYLKRAVPRERIGARVAAGMVERHPDMPAQDRLQLLELGLELDRTVAALHALRAVALLDAAQEGLPRCDDRRCLKQAAEAVSWLKKNAPNDFSAIDAEARLLVVEGKAGIALQLMLDRCPRSSSSCLESALKLARQESLPLDLPAKALISSACPGAETCARAHRLVAKGYRNAGLQGRALKHWFESAQRARSVEDWMQYAVAARDLELVPRAREGLRRARQLPMSVEQERRARQLEKSLSKY